MRDIPSMLDEPFRGSEAVALGLLTPGQLRGARYRRLFPDVYVRAEAANDLALMSRADERAQVVGCSILHTRSAGWASSTTVSVTPNPLGSPVT